MWYLFSLIFMLGMWFLFLSIGFTHINKIKQSVICFIIGALLCVLDLIGIILWENK